MARAGDLGLPERAFILAGVGPLRSAKAAQWMRTHVPGVHIPDEIIRRMCGFVVVTPLIGSSGSLWGWAAAAHGESE